MPTAASRTAEASIVNIASMYGTDPSAARRAAYNATKGAVVAAVGRRCNSSWKPNRIRVSVVCPAFFRTDPREEHARDEPRSSKA